MSKILALVRAAAGEAGLSTPLGKWRVATSVLLDTLSTTVSSLVAAVSSLSTNPSVLSLTVQGLFTQGSSTTVVKRDFTPITTANATPTAIYTYTLSGNETFDIAVLLQAKKADGSTACLRATASFKSVSGVGAQVGSTDLSYTEADISMATCTIDIDLSGNDARVLVTGLAGTDVVWNGAYEYAKS